MYTCELFALILLQIMSLTSAFRATGSRMLSSRLPALSMSSRYISMQGTRVKVKKIFESSDMLGKEIVVKGWVKTLRDQKNFAFIEVNDGSTLSGIQAVVDASIPTFDEIKKCEIYYVLNRIHTVLILQPFPSHFLDSQLAQQ